MIDIDKLKTERLTKGRLLVLLDNAIKYISNVYEYRDNATEEDRIKFIEKDIGITLDEQKILKNELEAYLDDDSKEDELEYLFEILENNEYIKRELKEIERKMYYYYNKIINKK